MKLRPIAFVSLVAVSLAGYAGYLSFENSRLKDRLAEYESGESVSAESQTPDQLEETTAEAEVSLGENASGEIARVEEASPSEPDRQQRRFEGRQERIKRMLAMLEDPESRLDLIERNMGRIDQRFAAFFKTLDLSAEEMDLLKTLMAERELKRFEGQMRMATADEADREGIREETILERELLAQDINDLLGEEDAARLSAYTDGLPYRRDVEELSQSLSYTDFPLSESQSESIISAYTNVAKNFEYTNDFGGRTRGQPENFTPETVSTYLAEKEAFDNLVLEQVATSLNDNQLASLAEKQMLDRQQASRRMEMMLESDGGGGGRGGFGRGGPGGGGRPGF